jgi:hypothetical protein
VKFVILVDTREMNNTVLPIVENDGRMKQFATFADAEEFMDTHSLNKFPYHIVNIGHGIPSNMRMCR